MLLELRQVHAAVALHAVAHIPAQPLPQATQIAEGAVVDVPTRLVIEELADGAVVPRHASVASLALSCTSNRVVSRRQTSAPHRGRYCSTMQESVNF